MNAKYHAFQEGAGLPPARGLYDPRFEHESCGVGFVCHIKGRPSRGIVDDAKHINCSMDHRGGIGYEPNTGDGAGILTSLPHKLLARLALAAFGRSLPEPGRYGVGNVFLPRDPDERRACKERIEAIVAEQGQECLGWRDLPHDARRADLGSAAIACMPHMEQLFIAAGEGDSGDRFERRLYVIRKHASRELRGDERLAERAFLYFSSLSSKVIVYKGMLTPYQLFEFFTDLEEPDYETHLAMIHSRFSTNTFPSWDRAQPNRFMSHNGEINTLLGNCNWMNAREGVMRSELFGDDLAKLFPVVEPDCSDSGNFDNVLEFLLMSGRTLPAAVMMMIPEAWQNRHDMASDKRAFYEYNSCLMEPWDGPASIAFTDGTSIGAVLDRNGLRPSRYYITDDDRCIMASEVGVLPVAPERVVEKGRLRPGRLFFIDFDAGRMVPDHEIKADWAKRRPYGEWLARQRLDLADLDGAGEARSLDEDTLLARMQAFGYTTETMQFMLLDLVRERRDPLGSMGNDAALAVLSDKPRMLYDYFKQRFAQVTNPAIDSIREEVIMSLECYIGPEANLLEVTERHAHRLRAPHPILSNEELAALAQIDTRGWRARTLDITFPRGSGETGLREALARLETESTRTIEEGYSLLVLSDRKAGAQRVPISALLATGCVHHHLVRTHSRTRIGIIVETGEAREVHHHCLLIGYGADAVNPYLAFESLWYSRRSGLFADCEHVRSDADVVAAYRKGVAKGILKVLAKMGISTLQSYKGAQIFEAVGLGRELVERCFAGTASRVEGVGFAVLAEEMERRHRIGYPDQRTDALRELPNPGDFHWRSGGDRHMWDPPAIADLQVAARTDSQDAYWRFARHANDQSTRNATLRGLLDFTPVGPPVELEEVEPEAAIVRRFATGAMSFGSISDEAHRTLAVAMNRIGGKSNTGEGGEDPDRFVPQPNGDFERSAIKQVASGRFGVTIEYLTESDELQIKIVQGAKPGEGGELPGRKVDDNIARIRHSTPGVGLISPPPHHDIYSIEDIAQLIHDLKNSNPLARISVKLGAE
ncbi:MAG: glutamate synthase large subunit, partial [Gammaproteobacteria bacterium]|nr:glutamate synthase large subunit [Gammaproteobacteria bacterium]